MSTLYPVNTIIWRQLTNRGGMASRGWVYVYQSGGTVLADLYADQIATPIANPVQLDGSGKAWFYGVPAAYKVVITEFDGSLIDEHDPVYLFGNAGTGGNTGTSAVCLNYAEVRALTDTYDAITVCGRDVEGDGGQGDFVKTSAAVVDNDGTILVASDATKYVRVYDAEIDPRWFGVVYSTNTDQATPYQAAEAVGPVVVAGEVYFTSDTEITGTRRVLAGGFNGASGVKLTLSGTLVSGVANMFASNLVVKFNRNVTPTLYTSWFAGGLSQATQSSDYSYDMVFDADVQPSADVLVPSNFRFIPKATMELTAAHSITIKSLSYTGLDQWIKYDSLGYIGTIDFNGQYARPEWFGFTVGTSPLIDNRIAAKAALSTGLVLLHAGDNYYTVDTGTPWAFTGDLHIESDSVLLVVWDCRNGVSYSGNVFGEHVDYRSGTTLGAGKDLDLRYSNVRGMAEASTTLSGYTTGDALPQSYRYGDAAGNVESSLDLVTWSLLHAAGAQIKGMVTQGPVQMIAFGTNSVSVTADNGRTWVTTTLAHNVNALKYINGFYVVLCTDGFMGYISDPINGSWTYRDTTAGVQLNDMVYDSVNHYYIGVGNSAKVVYSYDIVSWNTSTAVPVGITGNLYCITANRHCQIIGGDLSGAYLRATDALSWYQYILPVAAPVYTAISYDVDSTTEVIALAGGSYIYRSDNYGISFGFTYNPSWTITTGAVNADGTAWIFGSGTNVVTSTDLRSGKLTGTGAVAAITSISVIDPVYLMSDGTHLVSSNDGQTWSSVLVPSGVTSINRIKQVNGALFLLCNSGLLYVTTSGTSFKLITFGISSYGLYDIAYYSGAPKYVVVGEQGLCAWITESAMWSSTVIWSVLPSATALTLKRVVFVSTTVGWAMAGDGVEAILTEAPGTSYSVRTYTINGMVITGTAYIRYGSGGTILRSTDNITYTQVVSGTTVNLLDGIVAGTNIVLVGVGVVLRSTDGGVSWTSITVTSLQINRIKLANGKLFLVTASHTAYVSADQGATWTNTITTLKTTGGSTYTPTSDWFDIWWNSESSVYYIVGGTGFIANSTDASAWVYIGGQTTRDLHCGTGCFAYGDNGTLVMLNGDYYSGWMPKPADAYFGTMNFRQIEATTLTALDSAGNAYLLDQNFTTGHAERKTADIGDLSGNAKSLAYDATNDVLHAVGVSTWTTNKKAGYKHWTLSTTQDLTGLQDMTSNSTLITVAGLSGMALTSPNGIVFTSIRRDHDTADYYSSAWVTASGKNYNWLGNVRVYMTTPYVLVVATATQLWIGPSLAGPVVTAATATLQQSTVDVDSFTITGGAYVYDNSTLRNASWCTNLVDSLVRNAKAITLGTVIRSNVTLGGTATLTARVSESEFAKTDATDYTRSEAFHVAIADLQVINTSLNLNGMLVTADTPLNFDLINCTDSRNWAYSLTNNALVNLVNCGTVSRNTTVHEVDGDSLDNSLVVASPSTPTSASTGWFGLPAATTFATNQMTLGADIVLGSAYSSRTMRYAAVNSAVQMLMQLGGRIKLTIVYPTGFTPSSYSQVTASLVRPGFNDIYVSNNAQMVWNASTNKNFRLGFSTPVTTTRTADSVTTYTNVWGGAKPAPILHVGGSDAWKDDYCDMIQVETSTGLWNVPIDGWVVIHDSGAGGYLPLGTKIQVDVIPTLPKTQLQYDTWFPTQTLGLDNDGTEMCPLSWSSYSAGVLQLQRVRQASSAVQHEYQYMSLGMYSSNPSDPGAAWYIGTNRWTLPGTYSYGTWPTQHQYLHPALSSAQVPIQINLIGLDYVTGNGQTQIKETVNGLALNPSFTNATATWTGVQRLVAETIDPVNGWQKKFQTTITELN